MGKAPDWSGLTGAGNGAGGPLSAVGFQDPAERQAVIERLRAMLAGAGPADAAGTDDASPSRGAAQPGTPEHPGDSDPPRNAAAAAAGGPAAFEAPSPGGRQGLSDSASLDGSLGDGPVPDFSPAVPGDGPFPDFLGQVAVGAVWGPDPAPTPARGSGGSGSAAGSAADSAPGATAPARGKSRPHRPSRRRASAGDAAAAAEDPAGGAEPFDAEPFEEPAGTRRPRTRSPQVPPWAREPVVYEDDAAAEAAARALVLRQLTGAPKTRRQLEQKLAEKDIPLHVSALVLDRFAEVELIDDAAFAESWVRQRARSKGLARSALRRELGQKGVDEASIDTALEQVDPDQERETARELVAKKLAGSTGMLDRDKAMRRLVGMLGRKGYSSSLAMGIIREEWDKLHG